MYAVLGVRMSASEEDSKAFLYHTIRAAERFLASIEGMHEGHFAHVIEAIQFE